AEELLGAQQQGIADIPLAMLRERIDTLASGESLRGVFARGGVTAVLTEQALKSLTIINPGRVRAGMPVVFRTPQTDSAPTEIVLQLAIDRLLHLKRDGEIWTESEERLPWTTDTVAVGGSIASTLYEAMDSSAKAVLPAGARQQLTWSLADVFEYKIDMSRDLQPGDAFRVLVERSSSSSGAVRVGRILAATFTLSGTELQAIRYASQSVRGDFFDQTGKSMRAAFLRAPLEFRRISSTFEGRFHPILGVWKQHKGTDYAAAPGPHLHFEVLVDGAQRDPRTALRDRSGDPVPGSERPDFERVRAQLLASLDSQVPATASGLAAR